MRIHALAALGALFLAPASPAQGDHPIGRVHPSVHPLSAVEVLAVLPLDRYAIQQEDELQAPGRPPRFAIAQRVIADPTTHGIWEVLDDTWSLWRLRIRSPNASHINLAFSQFRLPIGAHLRIYSADYARVVRPIDAADHSPTGQLWTPVVPGEEIVLEVHVRTTEIPHVQLTLAHVNSGYRYFGAGTGALGGLDGSGSCNVDVACPSGAIWATQIRAVAHISISGMYVCSGCMVNNTAQDGKNYFLTANHCVATSAEATSLVFYWNYQHSTCGGGDASTSQWNSGATLRATDNPSDFTLVELNSAPAVSWGVAYAGWDRTPANPAMGTCIHHPSGDAKKISIENDAITTTAYLLPIHLSYGTHLRVADWDLGTTEGGSSGSPLFNEDYRVVGQLHGGYAACGNDNADWFGRFYVSWATGNNAATRLREWLDPLNTGQVTLDSLACPPAAIQLPTIAQQPTSTTVCSGNNASFSVQAYSPPAFGPLSYVWGFIDSFGVQGSLLENPGVQTGTQTPTLTIHGVSHAETLRTYRCWVSNNCAGVMSANATLSLARWWNCSTPFPFPQNGTNSGNMNGGVYFDLTTNTTVTWHSLNYVAAATTTVAGNSSLNLYVGPSTWVGNVAANPGAWTLVGSTTPVPIPAGVDTPVNGVLNPAGVNPGSITFEPGTYGIALQAVGHSWRYSNGSVTLSDPNMTIVTGGASNVFLSLPTFTPRSINGSLDYSLGGEPMPVALRQTYGAGCYAHYRSFYELFPNSMFVDMSNTSMYLAFDGANNRWGSITAGTTPVNLAAVTSPSLGHGNDSNITIALGGGGLQPILFPDIGGVGTSGTTVEMCSNLYLNLCGSAPPTPGSPTVTAWLTGAAARIGNHFNADPSAGGTTHYDYDVASGAHLFTWLAVPDSNVAATSNTFQLAFLANGDCEFRWGTMSQAGGGAYATLIGFTPGGASLDPGNLDLSTRLFELPALSTSSTDQHALALAVDANPVLGSLVNLTTSNETGPSVGLTLIAVADLPGFSPVGLDLGFLGAPGCMVNITTSPSISSLITNFAPSGMTVPFTIPAGPSIIGQSFYSQSIWIDMTGQNSFFGPSAGLLTSNAVRLKIGAF